MICVLDVGGSSTLARLMAARLKILGRTFVAEWHGFTVEREELERATRLW